MAGLGKTGAAAAEFLIRRGARVRVTESASSKALLKKAEQLRRIGVRVEVGGHTQGFVKGCDLLVTSPGIPKESVPLREAKTAGIPVISEIELGAYFCKGRVIAVTGSNGKTTTCHLIHRMLKDGGKQAVLCGNVGTPFVSVVPRIKKSTFVVLEVSSFQLEDSPGFSPEIALLLNVSRNHLDRHKTFRAYFNAKKNIFRSQTRGQALLLNFDRPETRALAHEARSRVFFFGKRSIAGRGIFVERDLALMSDGKRKKIFFKLQDFPLKGSHNLENILAASLAAHLAGVSPVSITHTLRRFKTLPHRIEPAGEKKGVSFIDDSKSTTVDSTRAALEMMRAPVVLLAGGRDKGADFTAIEPVLKKKVRYAFFYGEAGKKIADSLRSYRCYKIEKDFRKAAALAFCQARPGDCVLLSPMCTSFDQFSSYGERGDLFKQMVKRLTRK